MVKLALLPIIVFLALLAVLGFLLAAANRHTRVIGVMLLSLLGLLCFVVVGGGLFFARIEFSESARRDELIRQNKKIGEALHQKNVIERIEFSRAKPSDDEQKLSVTPIKEKAEEGDSQESSVAPNPEAEKAAEPNARKLSVDLSKTPSIIYPGDRPKWVSSPSELVDGLSSVYIESGPHMTQRGCRRKFDEELEQAVSEYVNEYLDNANAAQYVRYDARELKARFLNRENTYAEIIHTPTAGPMHQMHAMLVFDQSYRAELDEKWRQAVAGSRLMQTGWVAGGILAFLCVAFGYFKLDTATKGYYTARLQFLSGAAILALIAAGVLLALWVPWV